jgi:DNA-binding FadR family transcriptional regulator
MLDRTSDRPLYRQMADVLREQIRAGELAPGDSLPSESRLCHDYDLGRTAVRQALGLLRAAGVIESTGRGLPYRVRVPVERQMIRLNHGDDAMVELGQDGPVVVITRHGGDEERFPALEIRLTG